MESIAALWGWSVTSSKTQCAAVNAHFPPIWKKFHTVPVNFRDWLGKVYNETLCDSKDFIKTLNKSYLPKLRYTRWHTWGPHETSCPSRWAEQPKDIWRHCQPATKYLDHSLITIFRVGEVFLPLFLQWFSPLVALRIGKPLCCIQLPTLEELSQPDWRLNLTSGFSSEPPIVQSVKCQSRCPC